MRQINSVPLGLSNGNKAILPRPVLIEKGQAMSRLHAVISVTLTNGSGAAILITAANALAICQSLVASWTLKFGNRANEVVDDALSFDDLRAMYIAMTGNDFLFNRVPLLSYQGIAATPGLVTVPASSSTTFNVEVIRSFVLQSLSYGIDDFCVGQTQCDSMDCQIVRGTFPVITNITQTGTCDVTFFASTVQAETDTWSNVPRLYRNNQTGLEQQFPAGGLLAMWEATAVGASTALNLVSVKRPGDNALHDTVPAARLVDDDLNQTPPGQYSVNQVATLLYRVERAAELSDIPTANQWVLQQAAVYLAPMLGRALYIPPSSTDWTNNQVAANVVAYRDEAKLVSKPGAEDKDTSGTGASIAPVSILTPDQAKYHLKPGIVASKVAQPFVSIPAPIVEAAKRAAQGTGEIGPQVLAQNVKNIGKTIPGARSLLRGGASPTLTKVAQYVDPGTASGAPLGRSS